MTITPTLRKSMLFRHCFLNGELSARALLPLNAECFLFRQTRNYVYSQTLKYIMLVQSMCEFNMFPAHCFPIATGPVRLCIMLVQRTCFQQIAFPEHRNRKKQ